MATAIVGTLSSSRLAAMDKFRVTWAWQLANIPGIGGFFDAPKVANEIRNWLPSAGVVPVSNPTALPGDKAIVFDVRVAPTLSGNTVAQLLAALDREPTVVALDVTRLEKLGAAGSSGQLEQDQADAAREAADAAVAWDEWLEKVLGLAKGLGKIVLVLGGVLIVGGVAYIVSKGRK